MCFAFSSHSLTSKFSAPRTRAAEQEEIREHPRVRLPKTALTVTSAWKKKGSLETDETGNPVKPSQARKKWSEERATSQKSVAPSSRGSGNSTNKTPRWPRPLARNEKEKKNSPGDSQYCVKRVNNNTKKEKMNSKTKGFVLSYGSRRENGPARRRCVLARLSLGFVRFALSSRSFVVRFYVFSDGPSLLRHIFIS